MSKGNQGRTRKLDEDDVAEGVLCVIGNTNNSVRTIDLDPLVGLGVSAIRGICAGGSEGKDHERGRKTQTHPRN